MSAGRSFDEQVRQQRDDLRDRLAALDYVAEQNAQAEKDPGNAKARERGGMVLDPVDPTRAIVPLVWLRTLLVSARMGGYGALANDATTVALVAEWNANYGGKTGDEFEPLHREHPELADALRAFMGIL